MGNDVQGSRDVRYLVLIRLHEAPQSEPFDDYWRYAPERDTVIVDVTHWDVGEDAVVLSYYESHSAHGIPYPWQGEDTIRYFWGARFLWVNGRLVGADSDYLSYVDERQRADIICAFADYQFTADQLKKYPNIRAVGLHFTIHMRGRERPFYEVRIWKEIPDDIDLYVYCTGINNLTLWGLSKLPNLRHLLVDNAWSRLPLGLWFPRGFKNLRRLYLVNMLPTESLIKIINLRNLRHLSNLKILAFHNKGINDRHLRYLYKLDSLRTVKIVETSVTSAGIAKLQKHLPNCYIDTLECFLELWY